jgi:ABC-type Fe3+-siderophore transport system permease subunit
MLLELFLVYLPAMVGNMAPVCADRIGISKWLNKPINERVLGKNKTVRGVVVATLAGAVTGGILTVFTSNPPYDSTTSGITFGAATGLAAIVADAVKSFFKRHKNIPSGSSWIPFDQIDFAIGASIMSLFFIRLSFSSIIIAIIFIGCASYITSFIGVVTGVKRSL